MRKIALLAFALLAAAANPLAAQPVVVTEVVEIEEFDVDVTGNDRAVQFQEADARIPRGIATFGPFRVLDPGRAALVDSTGPRSPGQFRAMLRAFPGIRMLEMIECPGTDDDRANLRLGEMVRELGIATHVPAGGSVRSGAVELFLAGVQRSADPGAEFAVHAWADEFGLEPKDYPADAPENTIYLDYYRAMGMKDDEARKFYAMTNSVSNDNARWMTTAELAEWVRLDGQGSKPDTVDSKLAFN